MVKIFTSRIKASNLAEMFGLTYSLVRNKAPLENKAMTRIGAMKIGRNISYIFNFSLSVSISTKFGIQT